MKIQNEGGMESEFDGAMESLTQIKGTYKSNQADQFDAEGTFTMDRL
jgi:hypothetical protein